MPLLDKIVLKKIAKKMGIADVQGFLSSASKFRERTIGSLTETEREVIKKTFAQAEGNKVFLATIDRYVEDRPDLMIPDLLKEPPIRAFLEGVLSSFAEEQHVELTRDGIREFVEAQVANVILED